MHSIGDGRVRPVVLTKYKGTTWHGDRKGNRRKDVEYFLESKRQNQEDSASDIHGHGRYGETTHFLAFVDLPELGPTLG